MPIETLLAKWLFNRVALQEWFLIPSVPVYLYKIKISHLCACVSGFLMFQIHADSPTNITHLWYCHCYIKQTFTIWQNVRNTNMLKTCTHHTHTQNYCESCSVKGRKIDWKEKCVKLSMPKLEPSKSLNLSCSLKIKITPKPPYWGLFIAHWQWCHERVCNQNPIRNLIFWFSYRGPLRHIVKTQRFGYSIFISEKLRERVGHCKR